MGRRGLTPHHSALILLPSRPFIVNIRQRGTLPTTNHSFDLFSHPVRTLLVDGRGMRPHHLLKEFRHVCQPILKSCKQTAASQCSVTNFDSVSTASASSLCSSECTAWPIERQRDFVVMSCKPRRAGTRTELPTSLLILLEDRFFAFCKYM